MVRCSIFGGSNRKGQKKNRPRSTSLSREETIASAFFCKCRRSPAVKVTDQVIIDENSAPQCQENSVECSLAPML